MGEKERLVLIDDDKQVLKYLRRRLELDGHRIVGEAESPADVLDLLQSGDLDFSMAIVDGLGGQGKDVAKALNDVNPDAKIIAYSSIPQPFGDVFVQKPDPGGELWNKVREL